MIASLKRKKKRVPKNLAGRMVAEGHWSAVQSTTHYDEDTLDKLDDDPDAGDGALAMLDAEDEDSDELGEADDLEELDDNREELEDGDELEELDEELLEDPTTVKLQLKFPKDCICLQARLGESVRFTVAVAITV